VVDTVTTVHERLVCRRPLFLILQGLIITGEFDVS